MDDFCDCHTTPHADWCIYRKVDRLVIEAYRHAAGIADRRYREGYSHVNDVGVLRDWHCARASMALAIRDELLELVK